MHRHGGSSAKVKGVVPFKKAQIKSISLKSPDKIAVFVSQKMGQERL
jgi:hypothetical protein